MAVGRTEAPYLVRLTVRWKETGGMPVAGDSKKWDNQWTVRYKPIHSGNNAPEALTSLDGVRESNNVWVFTSRPNSDPPHFADVRRGAIKGKNGVPEASFRPPMPIKLTISVECNGPCPEIDTGG